MAAGGDCCIVGYGAHARGKLLPALRESGWRTVALVSRTAAASGELPVFNSLDTALSSLPERTTYIVASPPSVHFSQVSAIVEAGCDVFVEKPAFLSADQVDSVRRRAGIKQVFVAEMFMYLEASVCSEALRLFEHSWQEIRRVDMVFTLPSVPQGTFRGGGGLEGSLFADIGCYPLSLLARAGIPLGGLSPMPPLGAMKGDSIQSVGGRVRGVDVGFTVGLAGTYRNSLEISLGDGARWAAEPFFFGRPGERRVSVRRGRSEGGGGDGQVEHRVHEGNAFTAMFSRARDDWLSTQTQRFREMSAVTAALGRLGADFGLKD